MVANVSKHTKYITTTLGFIQDQIIKHPSIIQDLQVNSAPDSEVMNIFHAQLSMKFILLKNVPMPTIVKNFKKNKSTYQPALLSSLIRLVTVHCLDRILIYNNAFILNLRLVHKAEQTGWSYRYVYLDIKNKFSPLIVYYT